MTGKEKMTWLRQLLENEKEADPKQFLEALKVDLFEDEVFVFTPKGEVKNLSAGSTPLDFAYSIHTDVGHRCVGAKVNGKIVPLHYQLQSGDIVEVMTAKQGRGPSRDWLKLVRTSRARNKIRAWFQREGREDAERRGREALAEALKKRGLPHSKVAGSPLLVDVIREMGFRKADDFYIALGQSKISTKVVANKVMQRLKRGEAVEEEPAEGLIKGTDDSRRAGQGGDELRDQGQGRRRGRGAAGQVLPPGARATRSSATSRSGRGITVHREDCRNVAALKKAPERFTEVSWDGDNEAGYRVELQVDAWDRTRLLEDLSRTFAEAGINILEASCTTKHPMVKNRFVVEVGDTDQLKQCDLAAAEPGLGLRRIPRHAGRLSGREAAAKTRLKGSSTALDPGSAAAIVAGDVEARERAQGLRRGVPGRDRRLRDRGRKRLRRRPDDRRRRRLLRGRDLHHGPGRPARPPEQRPVNQHNVTARTNGPDGEFLFDSPTIGTGTTTVNGTQYLTTGTYAFFCTIHPLSMQANLQVSALGTPVARPKIDVILGAGKLDKIAKKGKVPVTVKALTQADGVEVALKLGKTTVGSQKAFSLAAGQSRKLTLKLNKSGKSKLAKRNSAKLKATGEVPFGSPDTAKRTYK